MLARIALGWPLLLLRALLGLAAGVAVLATPVRLTSELFFAIAAYVICDGALALMLAASAHGQAAFSALLTEAIARSAIGTMAMALSGVTLVVLTKAFPVWALLSGVAAIGVALELESEVTGEWRLPLVGVLSVACGLAPLVARGSMDPRWVIGVYAMLFGLTMLALAMRLRQLTLEIAAAL